MKIAKWLFFIGLVAGLLAGPASPALAVDIDVLGHFYLDQTISEEFTSTGAAFDLYLNDYTTLSAEVALTPVGVGWFLGGKLLTAGWGSEVRPYFSMKYGTAGIAVAEDSGDRVLALGEVLSIGLEWSPWIALFNKIIEEGRLPTSVSALQLFTYHLELSYPIYLDSPGYREDSPAPSPRISLGIGITFD